MGFRCAISSVWWLPGEPCRELWAKKEQMAGLIGDICHECGIKEKLRALCVFCPQCLSVDR